MKFPSASVYAALVCICAASLSGCLYSKTHAAGIDAGAKVVKELPYDVLGVTEGSSSSFTFLWTIPVTKQAAIDEAVDEAIRAKGGDNLIELKIWKERQIWMLGTVEVIHVKGKAIRYTKL